MSCNRLIFLLDYIASGLFASNWILDERVNTGDSGQLPFKISIATLELVSFIGLKDFFYVKAFSVLISCFRG